MELIILLVVIGVILAVVVGIYNGLVNRRNRIDEALDVAVRPTIEALLAVEDERDRLPDLLGLTGVVDWTFPEVCHRGASADSTAAERLPRPRLPAQITRR